MIENEWRALRPRAIFTASETLLEFQHAAIERAFAAPVFNWYGTTEMTCNIVECAFGGLHYRTDYGVLELLEGGEMIATGLNNPAMPLIRYRAGDIATARPGTCECGCAFLVYAVVRQRKWTQQPTPHGSLMVCGIALARAAGIDGRVTGFAGRKAPQTERGKELRCAGVHYRLLLLE